MANMDTYFTRHHLSLTIADVRKLVPGVKLREAWVHRTGRCQWEFHYGKYYWHGRASDAYEARAKGWDAYLWSIGAEGYTTLPCPGMTSPNAFPPSCPACGNIMGLCICEPNSECRDCGSAGHNTGSNTCPGPDANKLSDEWR